MKLTKLNDIREKLLQGRHQYNPRGLYPGLESMFELFSLKKGYPLFIAGDAHCFARGQLVHTSKGVKPIDELTVKDKVLSYNEQKDINEYKSVLSRSVTEKTKEKIYKITMKDGTVIKVTENHRFFTGDRYVQIKDILISLPNYKNKTI